MRCGCGARASVITRTGPRCTTCWLARDGRCGTDGCYRVALPTSTRCWEHDPAVVWLEGSYRDDLGAHVSEQLHRRLALRTAA